MTSGDDIHDWVSIDDDDSTWLFDTSFLLSNYRCIYGEGCRSIEPEPDPTGTFGCCSHGAHFVDGEDRKRVEELATRLTDEEWQFAARARERGGPTKKGKDGEWVTRKAKGGCIFLNRHDFPSGPGCALHLAALNRGERPLDWKPAVCWQVPLRLDVHTDAHGYETVFVRAWQRRDWGGGGDDFNWWCTEGDDPIAFRAETPVYETAREELIELMGQDLYERLATELGRRRRETPVALGASRPII